MCALSDKSAFVCRKVLATKGINLVRFWGFVNGGTDPYTAGSAIQPKVWPYQLSFLTCSKAL